MGGKVPFAVVSGRGARRVRGGHPWVYRSDVLEASGKVGDVVRVRDERGRFLGVAFHNPGSEIQLRLVGRDEEEVVDDAWFAQKVRRALAYRASLGVDGDAYRLVHAEADGLPGLVADRYAEYVVLQVGSAAVERHLGAVVGTLREVLDPAGILLRADTAARGREGLSREDRVLFGEVPEKVVVREGEVRFEADLSGGQKTGLFLDQRENHLLVGRLARGRTLDAFAYAGGFALHAARNADAVEAVDSSSPALEAARNNARLNGFGNVTFTRANVFDLLRERSGAGERYDTVILDPPAFAKSRRDVNKARRAYKEINLRAMKLLSAGGRLVTCSCSFHLSREVFEEVLREAAADAGATMRVVEWRGQARDHPEILTVPENRYLKCCVLEKV